MAILTSHPGTARLGRIVDLRPLMLCIIAGAMSVNAQAIDEYKIKAAFLYNFAKFVEWPPGAFSSPDARFVICILGEDPFGQELKDAIVGRSLNGRAIRIARISEASQAAACHILFVDSSERKRMPAILQALPPAGILTVGENEGFALSGGIINFTLKDGHLGFEINRRAAERARLIIRSRLLALARIIDK